MTKKIKVIGMGNHEEYNYLITEKKEGFFQWLNKLLCDTFGPASPDIMYYDFIKENEKIINKKKKIAGYTDVHESYDTEENVRFDLFYGKNRVFVSFICNSDKRKSFMDKLEETSDFCE